ncbi:hypothetical protein [Aliiroseovarius sp. 2305UL8-7]|uniref:hypothetical protein n=1 Tax=Aliiroseovarius conchicola TaxID=3121637 RepID=UPI0035287971
MTAFKLAAEKTFPVSKIARLGGGEFTLGKSLGVHDWQMVVVYRGKHCPYCSRYLQELDPLDPRLNAIAMDVVAALPTVWIVQNHILKSWVSIW